MRSAHYGCFQTEIEKNMLETAALRCNRPGKGRPHLLGRVITRPRPICDIVKSAFSGKLRLKALPCDVGQRIWLEHHDCAALKHHPVCLCP
jgi:hypothetical protein